MSSNEGDHKSNLIYFTQMQELKKTMHSKKDSDSFSSQNINFKDYLAMPDGYEVIFYSIYFILIPYLTGAILLFFFVAGASFENFELLEFKNFMVVWIMGYEVVATLTLISILISFLKYDDDFDQTPRHF